MLLLDPPIASFEIVENLIDIFASCEFLHDITSQFLQEVDKRRTSRPRYGDVVVPPTISSLQALPSRSQMRCHTARCSAMVARVVGLMRVAAVDCAAALAAVPRACRFSIFGAVAHGPAAKRRREISQRS